jgi:isoleucyl-tRNA synthetase
MGTIDDFSVKYMTLDKNFENNQLNVFFKAVEKKLVYQDLKPVY